MKNDYLCMVDRSPVCSVNKVWSLLGLLLFLGTLSFYVYLEQYRAIFPYSSLILLLLFRRSYVPLFNIKNRFIYVTLISYLFISFIGIIEVADNLHNFLIPFGKHADDSRYFERTLNLLYHGRWEDKTGAFEVMLSIWGSWWKLLWGNTLQLLDLLPFCWLAGAIVVGLSDRLCKNVAGFYPPIWLVALTFLCNYQFMKSVIHLYRDGVMLIFVMISFNLLLQKKHLRSFLTSIPILFLRGANFFLFITFSFLVRARNYFSSRTKFYIFCIVFFSFALIVVPRVGNMLLAYSSGMQNVGECVGLDTWSFQQNVAFRSEFLSEKVSSGSTLQKSMAGNSLSSLAIRPFVYAFFPIRMWSITQNWESVSPFAPISYVRQGKFLVNIYVWVCVSAFVIIIPLLFVGLVESLNSNNVMCSIAVFYIFSVFAVSFVSMQMRHGLAFIVLNLIISFQGYSTYKSKRNRRITVQVLSVFIAIFFVYYNLN